MDEAEKLRQQAKHALRLADEISDQYSTHALKTHAATLLERAESLDQGAGSLHCVVLSVAVGARRAVYSNLELSARHCGWSVPGVARGLRDRAPRRGRGNRSSRCGEAPNEMLGVVTCGLAQSYPEDGAAGNVRNVTAPVIVEILDTPLARARATTDQIIRISRVPVPS